MPDPQTPVGPSAPVKPLDVDGVAAMTIGSGLWAVALVGLFATGTRPAHENGWWLWVCLAGIGMGLIGIAYTRRRAAVYRAAASRPQANPATLDSD